MPTFQTTTHAKCILAGEHAVLRGCPAIVFPIKNKALILNYESENEGIKVDFASSYGENLLVFFGEVLNHSISLLNKSNRNVTGNFFLNNTIPMGAGMGFSSALCAAIAQWTVWKKWLVQNELPVFARELEHVIHGKSSGVDIVGALAQHPTLFKLTHNDEMQFQDILIKWQPKLYLSYSNTSCATVTCIRQVETLWKKNLKHAQAIDASMRKSVILAQQALHSASPANIDKLASAIQLARNCFQQWGLIPASLQDHLTELENYGAIAAKPTGSGGGGYVISLWRESPKNVPFELIKIG